MYVLRGRYCAVKLGRKWRLFERHVEDEDERLKLRKDCSELSLTVHDRIRKVSKYSRSDRAGPGRMLVATFQPV